MLLYVNFICLIVINNHKLNESCETLVAVQFSVINASSFGASQGGKNKKTELQEAFRVYF